jgi:hypothetical protein
VRQGLSGRNGPLFSYTIGRDASHPRRTSSRWLSALPATKCGAREGGAGAG